MRDVVARASAGSGSRCSAARRRARPPRPRGGGSARRPLPRSRAPPRSPPPGAGRCAGFCPGVRSIVLKYAPARTGESISMTSDVVAKVIVPPASPVTGSAVPYFQPAGSFNDGLNIVALSLGPCGIEEDRPPVDDEDLGRRRRPGVLRRARSRTRRRACRRRPGPRTARSTSRSARASRGGRAPPATPSTRRSPSRGPPRCARPESTSGKRASASRPRPGSISFT